MRRAVLHLGDLGLGVALRNPIRVGKLLALALPLQTRQVLGSSFIRPARDPFELQVEQVVNPRRLRKPAGDLRSVTGDGRREIVKRESTDRV